MDELTPSAGAELPPGAQAFGDFIIPPGPEDIVPPDTMAEYEEGMQALQFAIEHAGSQQEVNQIIGRYGYVAAGIIGFAAETSFDSAEQASTVLRLLHIAGLSDRYGVLRMPHVDFLAAALVNIPAAERIVRGDERLMTLAAARGYELGDETLDKNTVLKMVSDLYSTGNSKDAVYAMGVLSGFAPEAAANYAEAHPRDVRPLGFVDPQIVADLTAGHDVGNYEGRRVFTPDYTHHSRYDMAPPDHRPWTQSVHIGNVGVIRGYGVWYKATVPPGGQLSEGEIAQCQRYMQANEQLGLTTYLQQQAHFTLTDGQTPMGQPPEAAVTTLPLMSSGDG